jgi:CCR4-NOT transcription complex subunit 6
MRGSSFASAIDDEVQSVDSGSFGGTLGNKGSNPADESSIGSDPSTPRGYVGGFIGYSNDGETSEMPQSEEWVEISRDQLYVPGQEDVGRKLKLEAAAYSSETGELLRHRVVKTDLVLCRAPNPPKRNLVTSKVGTGGGGARFRIISYNVLSEIYATQQQYPYCDFWALSWDYR